METLANKYRPKKLEEIVGQKVAESLNKRHLSSSNNSLILKK